MENAYYVTHPRIDKTAVVFAPATEKARTTFLDWLERNGLIRRAQRHLFRRDMIAERIEDPNVPADVELHYGYEESPSARYTMEGVLGEQPTTRGEPTEVQEYDEALGMGESEVHDIPVEFEEPEVQEEFTPLEQSKTSRMPIQKVMLRGYGE